MSLAVSMPGWMFLVTVAVLLQTLLPLPSQAGQPLEGHLEKKDQVVRLKRPVDLPILHSAVRRQATAPGGRPATAQIRASDFVFDLSPLKPAADETRSKDFDSGAAGETSPVAEGESADMVIAWEKWHKRVAGALYERWTTGNVPPGRGRVTLTFTADRHVSAHVDNVELPPGLGLLLALRGNYDQRKELEDEFSRYVLEAIASLNGSDVLAFPQGSQRKEVVLPANFNAQCGETSGGYTWKKDDYERVHLK